MIVKDIIKNFSTQNKSDLGLKELGTQKMKIW